MEELGSPFKKDKNNLWYFNYGDIRLKAFKFPEIGKSYEQKCSFYHIEGIDNYIVKDTTLYPLLFNYVRTMSILKRLEEKQNLIPDVDFPIGYCKKLDKLVGTIIPYYQDAVSLRSVIYINKFDELKNFYNHDSNEIDNLITLCLNILDLVRKMYEQGVIYVDIHSGNFLFYHNEIKVIDFEPGFVFFSDRKDKHYDRLIKNYTMLVEKTCRRLGFGNVLLKPGDTFIETENKVKVLRKRLER